MKKILFLLVLLFVIAGIIGMKAPEKTLKVFISVDMEGIAGVISSGGECNSRGRDYDYFRKIMTGEANAAVAGALDAGATEITVRDGHGSKTNIIPGLLHEKAKLLRGATSRPENMMLALDETYDAVIFIGYHAKAGTKEGVIAHTSSGNVIDLSVNGVSLPEAGYNALIAGLHDVPVVFISGDNWICGQAQKLFGDIVTCRTKVGIGGAELGLHPDIVIKNIRQGVETAVRQRERFKPYKLSPPYTMVLKVKNEKAAYPGAKRTGEGEFTFTSSDFLEVMDAFNQMK